MSTVVAIGLIIAAFISAASMAATAFGSRCHWAFRVPLAAILAALAAFSGFGILATFEPPGSPLLRLGYAALFLVSLSGSVYLSSPASSSSKPRRAFPRIGPFSEQRRCLPDESGER